MIKVRKKLKDIINNVSKTNKIEKLIDKHEGKLLVFPESKYSIGIYKLVLEIPVLREKVYLLK